MVFALPVVDSLCFIAVGIVSFAARVASISMTRLMRSLLATCISKA